MSQSHRKPLRPNPFGTYRDPQTGKWLVIRAVAETPSYLGRVAT